MARRSSRPPAWPSRGKITDGEEVVTTSCSAIAPGNHRWRWTHKGRASARGMAQLHLSNALNPSHITPRPPLSTNVTKAPARPNGQALARRATRLIPGGVHINRGWGWLHVGW